METLWFCLVSAMFGLYVVFDSCGAPGYVESQP